MLVKALNVKKGVGVNYAVSIRMPASDILISECAPPGRPSVTRHSRLQVAVIYNHIALGFARQDFSV